MNQTPIQVIYIVIWAEAILAFVGVSSICLTMFFKNYSDPATLTAIITITSGLVGSLSTILANPRQPSPGTVATTTVTTPPDEPKPPPGPVIVKVEQPPSEPIPTVETSLIN